MKKALAGLLVGIVIAAPVTAFAVTGANHIKSIDANYGLQHKIYVFDDSNNKCYVIIGPDGRPSDGGISCVKR